MMHITDVYVGILPVRAYALQARPILSTHQPRGNTPFCAIPWPLWLNIQLLQRF